ncbi:MAG: fibronectin type III domain-containing protein [Clostridiales bacterium]|nr:fibronectin type III domain-containing protein [Clostridiales bacterium]
MRKLIIRYMITLACLIIITMVFFTATALADPYPSNVHATPVDATTIQVTWSDNAWAQSYRVYRNMDMAAEVAEDVNVYLDTGLLTGMAYYYRVASVVDGIEYSSTGSTATWAMPLDAPSINSVSSEIGVDYEGHILLLIDLTYTAVTGATGYEIFAREEGVGAYTQVSETIDTYVTVGYSLPDEATRYWFKVRACNSFLFTESDEYQLFSGPFSDAVYIDYTPLQLPNLGGYFLYEEVWPWDDPWAAEYLASILDVYGNPQKWPQDIPLDTAMLSELARKLMNQEELTAYEQRIVNAVHPHGLALLLGVYESPPGKQAAEALSQHLAEIHTLLGTALPEALSGEMQQLYFAALDKTCALASLSMGFEWDDNLALTSLQINAGLMSDIVFSNLPGVGAMLEYITMATPTQTPAPASNIQHAPAQFVMFASTPTPTPTPAPIVLTIRLIRP